MALVKRGDFVGPRGNNILLWSDHKPTPDIAGVTNLEKGQIAMAMRCEMTNHNGTPQRMIRVLTQKGIVGWAFEADLVLI